MESKARTLIDLPGAEAVPERVREALNALKSDGHSAFVVGGAVRDLMLKGSADDWDIATSAHPARMKELFKVAPKAGERHGSVLAVFADGTIDITTYRGETGYSDMRRPDEVSFLGSIDGDLARRDFTVNAMAWDPDTGELVDPFFGRRDLASGIIRAVGDASARFSEDALRMMRALRFASVLCFRIEPKTLSAISAHAEGISRVSAERKALELGMMVSGRCASAAVSAFVKTGLARIMFPGLSKDGLATAASFLDELPEDPVTRLSAFIASGLPAGPERVDKEVRARAEALKLPKKVKDLMGKLTEALFQGYPLADGPSIRRWAALLGWEDVENGLDLRIWYDRNIRRYAGWKDELDRARKVLDERPPLSQAEMAVKGSDIAKVAGGAGPKVKALMNRLFLDVLDAPELNDKQKLTMLAWLYLKGHDGGGLRQ